MTTQNLIPLSHPAHQQGIQNAVPADTLSHLVKPFLGRLSEGQPLPKQGVVIQQDYGYFIFLLLLLGGFFVPHGLCLTEHRI